MPKVPISFACGLYDRMLALHTGEVKPEGIDLNFLAIDDPRQIFDRMAQESRFRRLRNVELRGHQPARRRPQRNGCAAGVSLARVPSRLHHGQPQGGQVAEGPRGQAHRRPALHPDRGALHPRLAAGRVRRRSVGRALGAGGDQQPRGARQSLGAAAAQARLDRTECIRSLPERTACNAATSRPSSAAACRRRCAPIPTCNGCFRTSTRSSWTITGARASSRSCISWRSGATSTKDIRSSPPASTRR